MSKTLRCSFCKKTDHQVKKLVAGPSVFICDECVGLAARIMTDDDGDAPRPPENRTLPLHRRLLDRVGSAIRNSRGGTGTARQTLAPAAES